MGNAEARWYVLHTYSGYESLVKDTIEKLIENNNLKDVILDIKIPMEETIEEKANGKKKVVTRKVIPCYVFVKLVYSNDMWFLLTNTRGVTGFVGPQGKAVPLTTAEVKKMRLEEVVTDSDIKAGDSVKVVSGALDGFIGTVKAVNADARKARVKVTMFGTETEVELGFFEIEKIHVTQ